jgi:hypothetical protein
MLLHIKELAMSIHYPATHFDDVANRIATPNIRQDVDRSFGLPPVLHIATFGLYFAFLTVMSIGFGNRELAISLAICFIFLGMAAAVPAKWATMKPTNRTATPSWLAFVQNGIETHTGNMEAKDAVVQVLILPVLIFLWGIAIVGFVAII